MELKNINGICFKDNNTIIKPSSHPFEKNIDNFPLLACDLLPISKYFLTAIRVKETGYCGTVIVARGCPFKCSYCSLLSEQHFGHIR